VPLPLRKCTFFPHPLPHHRHLEALERARPCVELEGALLHADETEALEIIQVGGGRI